MKQEGILSRWSRRKLQDPEINEREDQALDAQVREELEKIAAPTIEPPPELTDADMPALETLDEDSDYSGFMSSGVSDELRKMALRKLFSAPGFNVRDGLDEYDDDYTKFEKLGDVVTCDMKHQMEMEAMKKLQQEEDSKAVAATDESMASTVPSAAADDAEAIEHSEQQNAVSAASEQLEPIPEERTEDNDTSKFTGA